MVMSSGSSSRQVWPCCLVAAQLAADGASLQLPLTIVIAALQVQWELCELAELEGVGTMYEGIGEPNAQTTNFAGFANRAKARVCCTAATTPACLPAAATTLQQRCLPACCFACLSACCRTAGLLAHHSL
jgi:hypothetical protein